MHDGIEFFIVGSQETRESWHGGSVAGAAVQDLPLGTSGCNLRPGLWAAQVPWGGEDCQLLMEVGDALPMDGVTPYVRLHPLSCISAEEVAIRNSQRRGIRSANLQRVRNTSLPVRRPSAQIQNKSPIPHQRMVSSSQLPTLGLRDSFTLNILDSVKTANTSSVIYDFTLGGGLLASYGIISILPAADFQFWLIQPDQAYYLSKHACTKFCIVAFT